MNIIAEDMTIKEVEDLIQFIKDTHKIDYNVSIEGVKNSNKIKINFDRC